jgi:hypothetical protein
VEFVFCSAGLAVDVEPNAGAMAAGRLLIDKAWQDAFMPAGAGAFGAFCLLIAVAADCAVGPPRNGLVVLSAAGAGDWPADGILWLAWPSHRPRD